MFRLSKKTDYAIFLLTALARKEALARKLAGCGDDEDFQSPLSSATGLSDSSGVSSSLTANLLKDLSRAGILDSVRGQNGGYRLARPTTEINLRDILEVFEGPVAFVECLVPDGEQGVTDPTLNFEGRSASGSPRLSEACGIHGPCPAKAPMAILHNRILGLLKDLSLEEIAFHDLETEALPGKAS
jgi:DNA-binding IscR family transcriptional regulator